MKRLAVIVGAFALLAFTPVAASGVIAAPRHRVRFGTATNWAGYIAHGGPFTSTSTSWTEPFIACPTKSNSAVASFAGIDGSSSSTVEQIGTIAQCRNGAVTHRAFYEMYPKSARFFGKPVRVGDSLFASVSATTSKRFTLTFVNRSQGWTFSTQQRSSNAQLSSAEAITEAPTRQGSGVVNLANFGTINYSGTTANTQPISNFGAEAVTMVGGSGVVKAEPSALSGGSFSVFWRHA